MSSKRGRAANALPRLGRSRSRQKKISVNWESGFFAAVIHLGWIWHIFSQKKLAQPAKAGLGFGVPIVQAALAYVLGSDGEIGLLELPIFALPIMFSRPFMPASFDPKMICVLANSLLYVLGLRDAAGFPCDCRPGVRFRRFISENKSLTRRLFRGKISLRFCFVD